MAFEDIKLRGLTFAERSELIKAELDPLYTPLPEETPEPAKLLWYRDLAEWIMKMCIRCLIVKSQKHLTMALWN